MPTSFVLFDQKPCFLVNLLISTELMILDRKMPPYFKLLHFVGLDCAFPIAFFYNIFVNMPIYLKMIFIHLSTDLAVFSTKKTYAYSAYWSWHKKNKKKKKKKSRHSQRTLVKITAKPFCLPFSFLFYFLLMVFHKLVFLYTTTSTRTLLEITKKSILFSFFYFSSL